MEATTEVGKFCVGLVGAVRNGEGVADTGEVFGRDGRLGTSILGEDVVGGGAPEFVDDVGTAWGGLFGCLPWVKAKGDLLLTGMSDEGDVTATPG